MKSTLILIIGMLIIIGCSESKKEFPIHELDYSDYVKVIKRADWGWLPLEKG